MNITISTSSAVLTFDTFQKTVNRVILKGLSADYVIFDEGSAYSSYISNEELVQMGKLGGLLNSYEKEYKEE